MSARQLTYFELSTTASRLYTDTQVQIVLSESGKSAYELAVENGFVGTEIDWLASLVGSAGIDGLSAYEIAVNNGFIGNEAAWLASLQGADGTLTEISNADDVNITSPINGQYLKYDTSTLPAKWTNQTPDFFSYSINAILPHALFLTNQYFSILDTANYAVSPAPIVNFQNTNNLTLTNGIISGLSVNKYYEIEINYYKNVSTLSNGVNTIGLYDGSIATGSLLTFHPMLFGSTQFNLLGLKTVLTGLTNINPVVKYSTATYSGSLNINANLINVNVKEL
jgi:hypothetical protein